MGLADVGIMSFGFGLEMSHPRSGSTSASGRFAKSTQARKADIGHAAKKRACLLQPGVDRCLSYCGLGQSIAVARSSNFVELRACFPVGQGGFVT